VRLSTLLGVTAAIACGGTIGCGTSTPIDQCGDPNVHVEISRPADAPTEFRIERCQLDKGACMELCSFIEANNTAQFPPGGVPTPIGAPSGGVGGGGGGGVGGPIGGPNSFSPVLSCNVGFVGDSKVELDIVMNNFCGGVANGGPVVGGG
jgi:hypothetical protein